MHADKSQKIANLLVNTFPSLRPWIEAQYHSAFLKDMMVYADEPNAMIAMCEFAASIEAFADTIAEVSFDEMIRIMTDMGWEVLE
tara:strand:+ start:2597 stop:2851 length:255 start_codon:yes stop_codon:yes gene_type:complete